MAVLSSGDKSADESATHRSDGGGACGDHGGGQSKWTENGQEIPINFDVEKIVERTKKKCRKVGNLMSMAGAKWECVNTEGIDGGRSVTVLVANPCPYNVGVCVDGGRGGFALGYNLW